MKTIYLACIVLFAACTDPPPASVSTPTTVAVQNAPVAAPNALNSERTPDADAPVIVHPNAPLPTVPQPNPPCTSCPIGPNLPTH